MSLYIESSRVRKHNETVYDTMEPGDCIEFPRGLYTHYAICVGGGYLVHWNSSMGLSSSGSASRDRPSRAKVCLDNFWDVVEDSRARINNSRQQYRLPAPEIVRRAMSKVGEVGYNLIFNNCEHFVNWCCHDESKSKQAQDALIVGAAAIGVGAVVGLASAIFFSLSRPSEDDE